MSSSYFRDLNYSLGDEDSSVEYQLLEDGLDHVVGIAGSGGRMLPLLARYPKKMTLVDILDEQLYLTELRHQAMMCFNFTQYRSFLGYPPIVLSAEERQKMFYLLPLSLPAQTYLSKVFCKAGWSEIIYTGRFEQTLITLSKINRFITGRKGQQLFAAKNLEEQLKYLHTGFPKHRWGMVLRLLANTSVLNSLLYKGDFPKKNIPGSHFKNFKRIFDQLFTQMDINTSFFAQLCFFGKLINTRANPIEVDQEIFNKVKMGMEGCEIAYVKGDIITFIQRTPLASIDFISLSDVPSFLKNDSEASYLQLLKPHLKSAAKVIVRGNLRITHPVCDGFEEVSRSYEPLFRQESTQLWHINIYKQLDRL